MRFVVVCALLVHQLVPLIAHADGKATREFEAGVDAFRLGKLAEARAHLEKAIALDGKLPGPHRFLAAVAQADGRFADCIASTRTALELNPRSAELADTRKLHDACRASAGRAAFRDELGEGAAIAVTTSAPGATVTIDKLGYGGTPLAPRRITPGTHVIEVAKAGYKPARASVNALPGIVTDASFELVADATVESHITPAATASTLTIKGGDVVLVDGDLAEFGSGKPFAIAPGDHVIEVRSDGREPWRRRVHVAAGQQVTLVPELDTSHVRLRRRGWLLVGTGVGFLVAGAGTAALAVNAEGTSRSALFGVMGVSFGVTALCWSLGAYWVIEGRPVDRDAPPPFAILPIEGGALATTGFAW